MYQPNKDLTVTEITHPCLPQWRKRIDDAEKRGAFNADDEVMAAAWDACAMGEAHKLYPNLVDYRVNRNGAYPRDERLYELGIKFSHVVSDTYVARKNCGFHDARELISKIEQRLTELQNLICSQNVLG